MRRDKRKFNEVENMKVCRYDKDANTQGCSGCKSGCLDKKPAAYINREFEEAVKEMESDDRCRRNKAHKSTRTSL